MSTSTPLPDNALISMLLALMSTSQFRSAVSSAICCWMALLLLAPSSVSRT